MPRALTGKACTVHCQYSGILVQHTLALIYNCINCIDCAFKAVTKLSENKRRENKVVCNILFVSILCTIAKEMLKNQL